MTLKDIEYMIENKETLYLNNNFITNIQQIIDECINWDEKTALLLTRYTNKKDLLEINNNKILEEKQQKILESLGAIFKDVGLVNDKLIDKIKRVVLKTKLDDYEVVSDKIVTYKLEVLAYELKFQFRHNWVQNL